jgi:hypothetical protein
MGPEAKVKLTIKHYLRSLDACWWFMPAAHGYGVNGIPDFIGCYRGVFFGIEAKAVGKRARATVLQQQSIRGINDALGWALVADDLSQVIEMFRLIDLSLGAVAA